MIRRTLVVGVLGLVGAGIAATSALANHSWGSYHWGRTANPFTLTLIDTTSANWTTYVNGAASDWGSSTVLNVSQTNGTSSRRCKPVAGKIQVCDETYGNNGWLGLATIWTQSGSTHIAQATTKFNDTYFNSSAYNNPNEKKHVACQEIGHDFGLDHQSETGADLNTCMDYFSNTGANATSTDSTHPNGGDYDQLRCIYETTGTLTSGPHTCRGTGHLDSSNSFTSAGFVQAPGQNGVITTHHGGFTEVSYAQWANPIH